MSLNNVRAVGDDRPWKDEVERELKSLLDIIKYGKISVRAVSGTSGGGGGGSTGAGADAITATLPATYDNLTFVVGVDQDAFDHISSLDYAQFDTTVATGTYNDVGLLTWNDTDGTLEFGLKGGNVTLQIGQEQVQRVRNNTGSTLSEGTVVYITGSDGTNFDVAPAKADADATSAQTLGVLTETLNTSSSQHGFVTTNGLVRAIDLSYISGLAAGDILYLDGTTAGRMTKTKPAAPIHLVYVGYCLSANGGGTNSTIFVKPQNGYELDEIHDVSITGTVANNEVLAYTSATDLWENKTAAEAGLISTSDTGTVTNTMLAGSIENAKLVNSSITVAGNTVSLGGSTSVSLDNLSDVTISGPATDEVLKYNGTTWVNAASPGGGGGTVTSISAGTGLSASPSSPITTSGTLNLANTTVTAASYGSATQVPTYTVNAQGQLTAASNTSIQIAESQVTGLSNGYRLVQTLIYTSTTAFTKASYSWLRAMKVICVGGGGAGGGTVSTSSTQVALGRSGSSGGYSESLITNIAGLSATMYGVVGAGATGGTGGGPNGGASWFGPSNSVTTGALVIANGGNGGAAGSASGSAAASSQSIAGATAGTGDLALRGGPSTTSFTIQAGTAIGSQGGSTVFNYGFGGVGAISAAGNDATGYGGGGSGAAAGNSTGSSRSGGNGTSGIVIIELYA